MAFRHRLKVLGIQQRERDRFRIAGIDIVDQHKPQGRHSVTSVPLVNKAIGLSVFRFWGDGEQAIALQYETHAGGFPATNTISSPVVTEGTGDNQHSFDTTIRLWNFDPNAYLIVSDYSRNLPREEGPHIVETATILEYEGKIAVHSFMSDVTVHYTSKPEVQ